MKKRTLLFLRFVLILVTILVMTYSKRGLHFLQPGYVVAVVYFFSNVILYYISEKQFFNKFISFAIFLFDITAISLATYFTQGFETDFYLIYFLVIFIASVSQDVGGSLPIAIVASLFYGWMIYRSSPDITLLDSKILIRVPFLFIISILISYWAQGTRIALRKKEELERFNRDLKNEVEKVAAEEIRLRKYTTEIINSVPTGIIATGNDGIITTLNPEAERILDVKAGELLGCAMNTIHELDALWKKMEQSMNTNVSLIREEVLIENKNQEMIPIGTSISPLSGSDDIIAGCVVIFKDLSEIKALEEKLRHTERLSYLGKMASWVAHEIRNPLTSIDGFAQLLSGAVDKSKINVYSSEIRKGAQRIDNIIDDILSFAKTERKRKHVEIDIESVIRPIVNNITNTEVIIMSSTEPPVIKGDVESIRRVFVNLINNSIEALDKNGKLQINYSITPNHVVTEIIDNGKGISKENMKDIFTPFFTTKQRGTGLGLSIVKKIIDEHKGKIEIESKEGVGTTCRIYLPK
jgi:two-component system, sporulation sensor kinase E